MSKGLAGMGPREWFRRETRRNTGMRPRQGSVEREAELEANLCVRTGRVVTVIQHRRAVLRTFASLITLFLGLWTRLAEQPPGKGEGGGVGMWGGNSLG